MTKQIKFLEVLETSEGEKVAPGMYSVTPACIQKEGSAEEEDVLFINGFNGLYISRITLYLLEYYGKVKVFSAATMQ